MLLGKIEESPPILENPEYMINRLFEVISLRLKFLLISYGIKKRVWGEFLY
ncbi:MAG: hypothetical protein QXV82_09700 [Ignisphaera sp.]